MKVPMFRCACPCAALALFLALGLVAPVTADTLAGLSPRAGASNTVSRFTQGQSGDVAPVSTLGGAGSTLTDALSLHYDAFADELWVSDYFGQKVAVFDIGAQGQVAPRRSFSSPGMGQPRDLALLRDHNEIAVITSNCCITFYPLSASGVTAPLRTIFWGGNSQTQLNNPGDIVYSATRDRLWVTDYRSVAGESRGRVLVFARSAAGDAAPLAVIEGPATGFGGYVAALAIDEAQNELYVLAEDASRGEGAMSVSVFGLDAVGDVAPRRRIAGPSAGLINAADLSLDLRRRELVVASGAYGVSPSLRVFPMAGQGDIAPLRSIQGSATGTSIDAGWYAVVSVPPREFIFASGFEVE